MIGGAHTKIRAAAIALVIACGPSSTPPPNTPPPRSIGRPHEPFASRVVVQQQKIEQFFGGTIGAFDLVVMASRADLTAFAQKRWKVPELPCFAVAIGTGSTLLLLDPARWKTEACDHATDGPAEIDRIIAHELAHVFHGQHRRHDRELDQAEAIGWFVEGLATFAADQLGPARMQQLRDTQLPTKLADVWTGKAKYAQAGTLVREIDRRIGRAKLVALLPLSTDAEILAAIGMTEAELIEAWHAAVRQAVDELTR